MTVAEEKRRELDRLRGFGINPSKMVVQNGCLIAYIDQDTASDILDRESEWMRIEGRFIVPGEWTIPGTKVTIPVFEGMDNDGGCCFVEGFFHESAALRWLSNEYADTDTTHLRDAQRLDRELDDVCPIEHPDRKAVVDDASDPDVGRRSMTSSEDFSHVKPFAKYSRKMNERVRKWECTRI